MGCMGGACSGLDGERVGCGTGWMRKGLDARYIAWCMGGAWGIRGGIPYAHNAMYRIPITYTHKAMPYRSGVCGVVGAGRYDMGDVVLPQVT